MLLRIVSLVLLFVLAPPVAFAEGGCPPGQVPQQGNGWKTCIPVSGNDTNATDSQFHSPSTEARWISIAVDKGSGVLAESTESKTRAEAQSDAERNCLIKGGISCVAFVTAKNGCVTLVGSDTQIFGESAPTQSESESRAMDSCKRAGVANCYVNTSACAAPVYK